MTPTSIDQASDLLPAQRSRRARRSLIGLSIAATLTAGTVAGFAAPASADGGDYSTTLSEWASADWALGDAKNSTLTVAGGTESSGVIGGRLTTTKTISVTLTQSFCEVVAGSDVLVDRALSSESPVGSGVTVRALFGSATVKGTVAASGIETRTPAGTGGDCGEPGTPGAPTPITDSVKVNITYKNKSGSSPVTWIDPYQGGAFFYRDATGKGSVESSSTASKTLGNSAAGWFWGGAWVYPTGTSAPTVTPGTLSNA